MRVLVIGGMHGNEHLGIQLVAAIQEISLPNVTAVIANDKAVAVNTRFVDHDLNRSFPGSNVGEYERYRPKELVKLCRKFDIVLDFHNTHCPENDCGFLGESASALTLSAASWLGLDKVVVADYDCINKYAQNCLSVEISVDSPRNSVDEWLNLIKKLARRSNLPQAAPVDKFRFVYRMSLADRDEFDLPARRLRAFQPIPEDLAESIGVESPAYPIFIGDKFTPYNYGGLLNKLN